MSRTPQPEIASAPRLFHRTGLGRIYLGDSLGLFGSIIQPATVDLIMTSPPFGLVRKKDYGNVGADEYLEWFRPFARCFISSLKPEGSLVIDIGGAWIPGQPTRSLYHYELLVMLCREFGFHLAQEFFWWNPARLPTPAEWVTVRRIRVKDAINCIWWLSPTPWPKASNRRVLAPYSDSMHQLLRHGYNPKLRPSGHDISDKFGINNGGSIPPNLLAFPNTESNSHYLKYCAENDLPAHPARFPSALPEFFMRMLTNRGDLVVDPFGGSCVTGETGERLGRKWICCDIVEDYVRGAKGRFERASSAIGSTRGAKAENYNVPNPLAAPFDDREAIPNDGGKTRHTRKSNGVGRDHLAPRRAAERASLNPTANGGPREQLRLLDAPPLTKAKSR